MVASYVHSMRGAHRNVRLLLTLSAILGFTIDGGIYTVILNLYILRLDFGPEFVGQVAFVANLVFALGSLVAGWLGGRFGDRRVMVAGLLLLLAGTTTLPFAGALAPQWRGLYLIGAYQLAYLGLALYYVNSGPFLVKVTAAAARGDIFAMQSAVNSIASFAGGLTGGLLPAFFAMVMGVSLLHAAPYRMPLVMVGLLMFLAVMVVLQTRTPTSQESAALAAGAPGAPKLTTAYGLISFMAVVRFLQVAGVGAAMTFFNVYMDEGLHVATAQIGFMAASARLVAVPAALLGPALARRIGYGAAAVVASLGACLSILPIALIPVPGAAGLGLIGLMTFTVVRYPAFYVYIMERTPDRLRSTMTGAGEMAAGLSFALISLVGGFIIVRYGYAAAFLLGGALTLAGTIMFGLYVKAKGETVESATGSDSQETEEPVTGGELATDLERA